MARIIEATEGIITPYMTYDFPTIPSWHTGRMVLVGDAAHAASPSSGQGASMAIEDAVTLGSGLLDVGAEGIAPALARYESERHSRAEAVVEWGRRGARLLLSVFAVDRLLADPKAQRDRLPGQARPPGLADQGSFGASDFLMQFRHRIQRLGGTFPVHRCHQCFHPLHLHPSTLVDARIAVNIS